MSVDESVMDEAIAALSQSGYFIRENFLPEELCADVRAEIAEAEARGRFQPAGVGKEKNRGGTGLHPEIRGDGTLWFDREELSATQMRLWSLLEKFREKMNRELFLGLWDFEGHYAVYPPGAFYRKHLDRFRDDSKRAVTVVFFFNEDWEPRDGGALRMELPEGEKEVSPESGTAVFFLSDRIPHEVRETARTRMSFAGWYRTR